MFRFKTSTRNINPFCEERKSDNEDTFDILCSHSKQDVFNAFLKECEKLNIDHKKLLNAKFLPKMYLTKLLGRGFKPYQDFRSELCETFWDEESLPYLNDYDKMRIIIFLAGSQLMDFEAEIKEDH